MKIMQFWRGCPVWAAPFFDADGAGGSGEPAAASAEGSVPPEGAQEPSATPPGSEPEGGTGGEATGSLLANAGKEGAEGDPNNDPGKGEGKQGEEGKPDEGAKDGDGGPVTKEALVIPEGQEWDDEMGAPLLETINDAKLTPQEKTQKIIDMIPAYQEKLLASMAAADAAKNKQLDETLAAEEAAWAKASMADPEYGGDMWKANQAVIARGRDQLATPEAVAELEKDGLGNHPEILRMFYRAGKVLGEDPTKGSSGGGGTAKADVADKIFGDVIKKLEREDS